MMKNRLLLIIFSTLFFGNLFAESTMHEIEWSSIGEEYVIIGKLGLPIGSSVKVEGTVVSGESTRMKSYSGVQLLKITFLNGVRLEDEVLLSFEKFGKFVNVPKVGEQFSLNGFESGRFVGLPHEAKPAMIPAMTSFHFETVFVVIE